MNKVFDVEEQWKQWRPIEGLAGKYQLATISDTADGFVLYFVAMDDQRKKVCVNFEESIDLYRNTRSEYRLALMDTLAEQYGSDFYHNWTFFKIEHSLYVQWISKSSLGISDYYNFIHFAFITADSVLDIVVDYEPSVVITDE
jgi:hypothetical protein